MIFQNNKNKLFTVLSFDIVLHGNKVCLALIVRIIVNGYPFIPMNKKLINKFILFLIIKMFFNFFWFKAS